MLQKQMRVGVVRKNSISAYGAASFRNYGMIAAC